MSNEGKASSLMALRALFLRGEGRVHFVGIGGVSMRSLAVISRRLGFSVSGSDRDCSAQGIFGGDIAVTVPQSEGETEGADLVVKTHAIDDSSPAIVGARARGIPIVSRAEYLGELMLRYKNRICVSGSHGKSTVTAMLAEIFSLASLSPTVLSGAPLCGGEPHIFGKDEVLIAEACEYRNSFLSFPADTALILNIELDHPDFFENTAMLEHSFLSFASSAGKAIVNIDSPSALRVYSALRGKKVSFGKSDAADYQYRIIGSERGCARFSLYRRGRVLLTASLCIPGVFNAANASAAAAVAFEYGISGEVTREALENFRGVPRRLERIGNLNSHSVYYDYAHHPTEIRAAIAAVREIEGGEVTVLFKPHTYSRTKALYSDFVSALSAADAVIIAEIFAAREEPIEGIDNFSLARDIGERAVACADGKISEALKERARGSIIVMGAGDYGGIMRKICE